MSFLQISEIKASVYTLDGHSSLCVIQEGRFDEACVKFTTAMQFMGYQPDLSYNIALCHYMLKQYAPALKHIADIIERGIREHPGSLQSVDMIYLIIFINFNT